MTWKRVPRPFLQVPSFLCDCSGEFSARSTQLQFGDDLRHNRGSTGAPRHLAIMRGHVGGFRCGNGFRGLEYPHCHELETAAACAAKAEFWTQDVPQIARDNLPANFGSQRYWIARSDQPTRPQAADEVSEERAPSSLGGTDQPINSVYPGICVLVYGRPRTARDNKRLPVLARRRMECLHVRVPQGGIGVFLDRIAERQAFVAWQMLIKCASHTPYWFIWAIFDKASIVHAVFMRSLETRSCGAR